MDPKNCWNKLQTFQLNKNLSFPIVSREDFPLLFVPLDSEGKEKKYLGNLKLFVIHGKKKEGKKITNFRAPAGSKSNSKATNEVAGPQIKMLDFSEPLFSETKSCLKNNP